MENAMKSTMKSTMSVNRNGLIALVGIAVVWWVEFRIRRAIRSTAAHAVETVRRKAFGIAGAIDSPVEQRAKRVRARVAKKTGETKPAAVRRVA